MVHSGACSNFVNKPPGKYRPLACKPVVVQTDQLRRHGYANRVELFLTTKRATFREHSTIDLLYPSPLWLRNEVLTPPSIASGTPRVTSDGDTRVIDSALIRVTA